MIDARDVNCAKVVYMSDLLCKGFCFAGLAGVLSLSALAAQRKVDLEQKSPDPREAAGDVAGDCKTR